VVRLQQAPPSPQAEYRPPEPLPPPPAPLPSSPNPPARPRAAPAPKFPALGNYSFAPLSPQASPREQGRVGRSLNLAIGPVERYTADPPRYNPNDRSSDIQITGAQVGSDWMRDLQQWWIAHRYYPDQASVNGESGTVQIRLKVQRNGQVTGVELLSRSGSQWLDMGAIGTFRGARLPPFPVNTPQNEADVTLTIGYYLIRR
jgi:protein TonB